MAAVIMYWNRNACPPNADLYANPLDEGVSILLISSYCRQRPKSYCRTVGALPSTYKIHSALITTSPTYCPTDGSTNTPSDGTTNCSRDNAYSRPTHSPAYSSSYGAYTCPRDCTIDNVPY